jgi:hypothetical protein
VRLCPVGGEWRAPGRREAATGPHRAYDQRRLVAALPGIGLQAVAGAVEAGRRLAGLGQGAGFDRAVRGVAAGLRGLGLPAGARVMIRMGNDADYVIRSTIRPRLASGSRGQSSAAAITAAPESCIRNAASPAVACAVSACPRAPG